MKKSYYLAILLAIIPMLVIPVLAQEESDYIPSWIKVIAGAWYKDEIDDVTFSNAMKFLIENNIIRIENPIYMALAEESEIITNLNNLVSDLHIKIDEIEKSKDVLEEEAMAHEAEMQAVYEQEIENMRLLYVEAYDEKNNLLEANNLLNSQKTSLENTIEHLQNEIAELK